MMVTFVSQCEKKSLTKTRRVLDAFANRIGDNTWQTIITQDGLVAVKNLLRRTASKNTAVSCHWLRSRSRSEMLWVIGSRSKFNSQGFVPVNSTAKDLFMDIVSDKPKAGVLYANTHLQTLHEHLFAVGYVAQQLHRRLMPDLNKNYSEAIFISGCLHDIGKIDPSFQSWVVNPKSSKAIFEDGQHIDKGKFTFDTHPRHNEVSLVLYYLLDDPKLKRLSAGDKRTIRHAIYWHHAKPYRKPNAQFETYSDIYSKLEKNIGKAGAIALISQSCELLKQVAKIDCAYRSTNQSLLSQCHSEEVDEEKIDSITEAHSLPDYKSYKGGHNDLDDYSTQVRTNANNNNARTCLISADRMVSALSASELHLHIKNETLGEIVEQALLAQTSLTTHIDTCLKSFPINLRSAKQTEVAHLLADTPNVAVLAGAAGCGKTKIALEWAKVKSAKKIIWVCPRVQICQGLFYDLTSQSYLPDAQIEINTGEFKFTKQWDQPTPEDQMFSGDIVITTIDQVLNAIVSHTKADFFIDFLNAHVVFDEFHEYINMPSFNLLFAELVTSKKARADTLLVSATPHYVYVEELLEIDREDIITMPSFNNSSYRFEHDVYDESVITEANPLYSSRQGNTFVISNTATTAQQSFITNLHFENAVLIHSKYTKSDKRKWFDEVYESFKSGGTGKYEVLRSGPIVQAALNISCDFMVSEITSAENCLQRLGRLDRFGTNAADNVYSIAVPESLHQGKGTSPTARFLSRMFIKNSAIAWNKLLQEKLDNVSFTLPQLYQIYEAFHSSSGTQLIIRNDLLSALENSVLQISAKVLDPITLPSKKHDTSRAKMKKVSLRGNSRFVQMAVCDVTDQSGWHFCNTYAYQICSDERAEIDSLTADCNEIQGYGDSDNNLLAHMKKKHHNIMGGTKAYNDAILLNEARNPELPVYLSYTPADLDRVSGESSRHSAAIYYAVCEKQPIGAMSIKKLPLKGT